VTDQQSTGREVLLTTNGVKVSTLFPPCLLESTTLRLRSRASNTAIADFALKFLK